MEEPPNEWMAECMDGWMMDDDANDASQPQPAGDSGPRAVIARAADEP